ncbi:hypothetical protein [Brevibacterium atlanticum]|uniref:hypothetical protein n=1 Tax=Brevibacterium atlanticum TaxID=2697563 RepID=UPI001420621E|nr:hypothetical protein [Brevibacterium atlanticum]
MIDFLSGLDSGGPHGVWGAIFHLRLLRGSFVAANAVWDVKLFMVVTVERDFRQVGEGSGEGARRICGPGSGVAQLGRLLSG